MITRRARRSPRAERDGFGQLLHAEWTKFRTVRGWVIGMIVAGLLIIAVNFIPGGQCGGMQSNGQAGPGGPGCALTFGPTGQAVTDSFYFVHQPMASSGSITVRVTSMTGSYSPGGAPGQAAKALQPWSKAGIIIKASTRPGSAYAAMMVTGGHGVRMQWDYTQDTPGLAGAVSATAPRWLRLTRSGDTITGYDSADGAHWTRVGTATLPGLPATVQAGLFAASPTSSDADQPVRHRVQLKRPVYPGDSRLRPRHPARHAARQPVERHRHRRRLNPGNQPQGGGYRQSGGALTVTGSGDIAPDLPGGDGGTAGSVADTLAGTFAGLIALLVVATMFITAEFRRGLIRVTLTASPRRNRVLAAKAIVLGTVTFAVGLPAAYIALLTGERKQHAGGISTYPVPALTEVRMIVGTAALLAVAAVLALGIGAVLRRGAAAVTAVIAVIVLPYFFAGPLSRAARWRRGLAAAAHPGGGLCHPAGLPAVPAARRQLYAGERVLPAGAVGRLRGALPLGRPRAWPGRVPAAQEGRMTQAPPAQRAQLAETARARRTSMRDALHAEWTKARTLPGTGWLLLAAVALTVIVERRGSSGRQVPVRALRRRPRQDQPDRDLPRPGGHRHRGRAGRQQRIQHRHDPRHAGRDAPPGHRAGRQGSHPHRPGPGRRSLRRARLDAGRAADPARPRHRPRARLPGPVPGIRAGAAGRRRLGALPRPDRAAQPWRSRSGARRRGRHRHRPWPAVPVPDPGPAWPAARPGTGTSSNSRR